MKIKLLPIILFLFLSSDGCSQTADEIIENIRTAFQQLDYQQAKAEAEKVLQSWQYYDVQQLLEVHKILGVIAYTEGDLTTAQSQFEQALSLDMAAQLDSVLISPKIISYFNKIKLDFKPQPAVSPSTQIRYMLIPDPRPMAALRSVLLPGWGQLYKGQKKKGIVFITTAGIGVATYGMLYVLENDAHDRYRAATAPLDIERKYDRYNRLHKYRQASAIVNGLLWLYSFADALLTAPTSCRETNPISLFPNISNGQLYLSARFQL